MYKRFVKVVGKKLTKTSTPSHTSELRENRPEFVESPNERFEFLKSPDEGPESETDPALITTSGEEVQLEPS